MFASVKVISLPFNCLVPSTLFFSVKEKGNWRRREISLLFSHFQSFKKTDCTVTGNITNTPVWHFAVSFKLHSFMFQNWLEVLVKSTLRTGRSVWKSAESTAVMPRDSDEDSQFITNCSLWRNPWRDFKCQSYFLFQLQVGREGRSFIMLIKSR